VGVQENRAFSFPFTESAKSAFTVWPAGRTSIAIPFHNHLNATEVDYVSGIHERALELEDVQ
jgi:hypothetical protein